MRPPAAHVAWGEVADLLRRMPQQQWLSPGERSRLAGLRSPRRREQFLAARWLLRQLLADVCGGAPLQWGATAPEQGPPAVWGKGAAGGLHIAISHSGTLAACAVATAPIGLDIEMPLRRRDLAGLAALCCGAQERALLEAQEPAARETLFYAFWTAKEAWIKRHGEPLAPARLQQIALAPAGADAEAQARVWEGEGWTLALAAQAGSTVRWWAAPPRYRGGWAVRDAARPA